MRLRFLRLIFSVCLSVALVVAPIRAYAVFPLAILPGIELVFSGSSITLAASSSTMAAAYAAAIGAVGSLLAINFLSPSGGGSSAAMQVRINDTAPLPVPTGWTAPAQAGDPPIPPSTVEGTAWTAAAVTEYGVGPWSASDRSSLADAILGSFQGLGSCSWALGTVSDSNVQITWGDGGQCEVAGEANVPIAAGSCPVGYAYGTSGCEVSNASAVMYPSDGRAGVTDINGSMDFDARDPDSSGSPPNTVTRSSDGKILTIRDGTSSAIIASQSDGTKIVSLIVGRGDGTSDRLSLVVGQKDGATGASGGTPIQGGLFDRVIGEGGLVTTTSAGGSGSMTCPGCATETTLALVRAGVDSLVNTGVKVQEQGDSWSTSRNTATGQASTAQSGEQALADRATAAAGSGQAVDLDSRLPNHSVPESNTFSGWWAALVPTAATCSPLSFASSGRWSSLGIDICPVLNALRTVLEWGLYGLTAIVIYQSWFANRQRFSFRS